MPKHICPDFISGCVPPRSTCPFLHKNQIVSFIRHTISFHYIVLYTCFCININKNTPANWKDEPKHRSPHCCGCCDRTHHKNISIECCLLCFHDYRWCYCTAVLLLYIQFHSVSSQPKAKKGREGKKSIEGFEKW